MYVFEQRLPFLGPFNRDKPGDPKVGNPKNVAGMQSEHKDPDRYFPTLLLRLPTLGFLFLSRYRTLPSQTGHHGAFLVSLSSATIGRASTSAMPFIPSMGYINTV